MGERTTSRGKELAKDVGSSYIAKDVGSSYIANIIRCNIYSLVNFFAVAGPGVSGREMLFSALNNILEDDSFRTSSSVALVQGRLPHHCLNGVQRHRMRQL